MEDTELEALAGLARKLLIVALLGVAAALIILAVDYQLKKRIVAEADQLRHDIREAATHGIRYEPGRPAQAPSRAAAPAPAMRRPAGGPVDADTGAPADGYQAQAAPIVPPGDDKYRPPHRGAVDGA